MTTTAIEAPPTLPAIIAISRWVVGDDADAGELGTVPVSTEVKCDGLDGRALVADPGDDVRVRDSVSMLLGIEDDVSVVGEGVISLMEHIEDDVVISVVGDEREDMVEDEMKFGEVVPPPTPSSKVYSM